MTMGKQFISGTIDTGSFELVVFGASCTSCGVAAHYNPTLSGTFEEGTLTTSQNYGSGETYCYEGFEQVSIGPYPPKRQMFWEVIQAQMPVLEQAAFEAIIGVRPAEQPLVQVWHEVEYYVKDLTSYYEQAMMAPQQAIDAAEDMVKIAIKLGSELPMLHTWSIPQFSICMGARNGADGIIVWNDTTPFDEPALFTKVPVIGSLQSWSANLTVPALTYLGSDGNATSLGCDSG
uniref:Peptidase A1 domain-containing protein n=1 Tax=Alexandrium monilatum TaxID=311494 RepID=A0A7S4SPD9_9DINO